MVQITAQYVIAQIITFIAYSCFAFTYCSQKRSIILFLSFLSNFLNACAYSLLGAYTSSAMCGISILRDIVFIIDEKMYGKSKKITKKDIFILMGGYLISVIAIISTFKGVASLLYATAAMLYTYSIWQKNNKIYKFMGIPCSILVIIESLYIKSILGLILQCIVLTCMIVGINKSRKEIQKMELAEIKNKNEDGV